MLDYMRKNQSSIIIRVVFGVLTLVMIGFGVQYAGVEGGSTELVAEVNDQPIYRPQVQRAVSRMVETYRSLYREGFSTEMLQALKFKDQALDDLIRVSLLRQEAERLGFGVSNEELRETIALVPAFQENGRFSFSLYDRVLRNNRMTPSDFEEAQREDLLVRKLQELLLAGVYVSEDEVRRQYEYDNEQASLRYLLVGAAALEPEIEVTDEQRQAFYDANQDRFREPERVRADVVQYSAAAFVDRVTVEDADIDAYYQAHSEEYEKPLDEVREQVRAAVRLNKAVVEARRAAQEDHAKAVAGGDFGELASASGGTVRSVGPIARTDALPDLGRVPELTRALFAATPQSVGDVVETESDAYFFRVVEKLPARVPALSEIGDRVTAETRRDLAAKRAVERAGALLAKLQETKDIAAVAAAEGLEVRETEAFRRLDSVMPGLGTQADLREDAFGLSPASPVAPKVYELDGDAIVAVLRERVPADASRFDEQKEAIRERIEEGRKRLVVERFIEELRRQSVIRIHPDALDRVYVS